MMRKLSGALGLALLAAAFVFGGSAVYAQAPDTEALAVQAAAPDSDANGEKNALSCGLDRSDAASCKTDAESEALPSAAPDIDQASSAVDAVEPLAADAVTPGITSYDAIVIDDVIETVTVAVPGEKSADEGSDTTGSLPLEESTAPPASIYDETTVGDADAAIYDDLE
jgi:hypothetical protein